MKIIPVELGKRSYDIEIAQDCLHRVGISITSIGNVSRVVMITDNNVDTFYSKIVSDSITERGLDLDVIIIPAGEESKNIKTVNYLWETFLDIKVDRYTVVISLGGGVIGDITGFVSATYARGIRFFQVPTTLLAQVDSSVGGKTGIDLPNAKNMVGAFHQPTGVLVDPTVLKTLPEVQYRSGLGEVVKYGVSLDSDLFFFLEQNLDGISNRNLDVLSKIIERSCQVKANIIHEDECETLGIRTLLNYGHTFGHALETALGYGKLPHGYGVAVGSVLAAKLAYCLSQNGNRRFEFIDRSWLKRQASLISQLGLPTSLEELSNFTDNSKITPSSLIKLMGSDKKTEHGCLNFVLPTDIGKCTFVRNVAIEDVLKIFE